MLQTIKRKLHHITQHALQEGRYEEAKLALDRLFLEMKELSDVYQEGFQVSGQLREWQQYLNVMAELLLQLAVCFEKSGDTAACADVLFLAVSLSNDEDALHEQRKQRALALLAPVYTGVRAFRPLQELLDRNRPQTYEEQAAYLQHKISEPIWAFG